jgi:hypothetical protein
MTPISRNLVCTLALALAARAPALEIVGDAPKYLDEKSRAEWRMKPLRQVLDDIANAIEKPLTRSNGVEQLCGAAGRVVLLVDDHKVPLRETLEILERIQGLHIVAEPLRLQVETAADFRDRQRRLVNFNLRDYAAFFAPADFPAHRLGPVGDGWSGGSIVLGGNANDAQQAPDDQGVMDFVAKATEHGDMQLRGHGNVYLSATADEEAEVRRNLAEVYRVKTRRTEWTVVFGTMGAGDAFPTGVVPIADAQALAARLHDAQTLSLASMGGQRVHAMTEERRSVLEDSEIVSQRHDPKVSVSRTGRCADLRPIAGHVSTWIGFHLSWVDPLPDTATDVRSTGDTGDGEKSVSLELKKNEEDTKQATLSLAPGQRVTGESLPLTLSSVWTWQPIGECYLEKGTAMIFAAEHPAGRAVIVLEETP